jgi:PAS domain S-box-containing protein
MPTDPKHIIALRRKAEKILSGDPKDLSLMSGSDLQGLVHGLSVYQIELEMQNEELRRSRGELEQSRSEYEELYDFAPVGYLTFDTMGLITRVNLTACGLVGIERTFLLKQPFTLLVHPESQDLFYFHRQKVVETTTTQTCQLVLKRKDGTIFNAQLESIAVQIKDNLAINSIMTDITERKQTEEALELVSRKLNDAKHEVDRIVEERTAELKDAYESLRIETEELQRVEAQLRQAQKMEAVGTLAGGIAHDFNNILAAIMGFSEIAIDKTPEASPARSHMERVFRAGLRGRDLVKQILTFSRQTEPEMQPLKLVPVVKEALALLRASLPSTVDIRANLEGTIGFILADPIQIQQVVLNLCTNAAHAMKQTGGIILIDLAGFSLSCTENAPDPTMSPGFYARLSVTDTGVGITPDILGFIFDPFFTTKAAGEGTGLGLSVVHGIVANHGGTITVSSQPGKGTTFTVYLPKFIEEQSQNSADGDSSIPRGHERILFIDDEKDLAAMGDEMLSGLGYHVTSATCSREALALFRLDPARFDLVISDQTMPYMTGMELAREVLAVRHDMPVILCTGYSQLIDADKTREVGIKAFTMKPLTKREIAQTIREVLDEKTTASA